MPPLDHLLTLQLAVAWAGESGESPRLGWWRTDLASEFGGEDLFRRLLPGSWRWATLQGARAAATRTDAALRAKDRAPDDVISLFHLGFVVDEQLDARLTDLKSAGRTPEDALPGLRAVISPDWSRTSFAAWVRTLPPVEHTTSPTGRRVRINAPKTGIPSPAFADALVAALDPLGAEYPLPHVRRDA